MKKILFTILFLALPLTSFAAFDFNGTTQYFGIKNKTICNSVLTANSAFSVSLWLRRTNTLPGMIIYKSNDNGNSDGWFLVSNGSSIGFHTIGSVNSYHSVATTSFPVNIWTHLVVTVAGDARTSTNIRFFVNGVEPAYASSTSAAGATHNDACTATSVVLVGKGGNGTSAFGGSNTFWTGGLDGIRFFNRVLSLGEIQGLSKGGYTGANLLTGSYDLYNNSVQADLSGKLNYGTTSPTTAPSYKGFNIPRAIPFN